MRRRPRFGARTVTLLARRGVRQADRHRGAFGGLAEIQRNFRFDVGAAEVALATAGGSRRATPAVEEVAEDIADASAGPAAEQVGRGEAAARVVIAKCGAETARRPVLATESARVKPAVIEATATEATETAGSEHVLQFVVFLALFGIADDGIRLAGLFKPLFRGGVARVAVRVVIARDLAVRLLNLILASAARNA